MPAVRVLSSFDAQHRAVAQRGDSAVSNLPALREGVSNEGGSRVKSDHMEWRRAQDEKDRAFRLRQEMTHRRELILTMAVVIIGLLLAYFAGFFVAISSKKSATNALSPENLATTFVACLQFGEESE